MPTYGDSEPLQTYASNRPKQFPANYEVAVYGVIGAPSSPRQVVDQDSDDISVVRASTGPLTLDTRTCEPADPTTVTLAAMDDDLPNATGIGFWSSQALAGNQTAEDSGRFLAKAQLAPPVGTGTLRSGAAATLLEFVGAVNCAVSGGADIARLFKPYMQFEDGGDGRIRRNWDRASNYLISRQARASTGPATSCARNSGLGRASRSAPIGAEVLWLRA